MQYMTNTKNISEEDAALVMSLSGVAEATCSFIISIIGTITLNKKMKELNTRNEKIAIVSDIFQNICHFDSRFSW